MTPSNNNIYVANYGSGTVIVIDPSSNTVVNDVVVNNEPTPLEFNSANNNIYMTNRGSRTVSVIDGGNNTLLEITMMKLCRTVLGTLQPT
jgi:YVTN family beta-propeller protein